MFFPVSIVSEHGLFFSEEYIFMGGEDGDFFQKASDLGYKIVWNNEAIIYEDVPKARTQITYLLKKSYYNGYAGAFSRMKNEKRNKIFYFFKNSLVLLGNLLLIIPAFFMGLTFLFNILCICSRTFG